MVAVPAVAEMAVMRDSVTVKLADWIATWIHAAGQIGNVSACTPVPESLASVMAGSSVDDAEIAPAAVKVNSP
jgi:hypothetical protein